MRTLLVLMVLLLLLPIGFGISVQADETLPPPDPGLDDEEDGDIEGDHPWGGENVVVDDNNTDTRQDIKEQIAFDKYIRLFVFSYYGIDMLERPSTSYVRPTVYTRSDLTRTYSTSALSTRRSR